jgi:hypothetical protein
MPATLGRLLAGVLLLAAVLALGTPSACGQGLSAPPSLGGYGAAAGDSLTGMGGPIIPYGGKFGGFMPYRAAGAGLSFAARGPAAMGSARPSFALTPMSRGMDSKPGAVRGGLEARGRTDPSFGSQSAMGFGRGMRQEMPAAGVTGVMPPTFSYPFYQPPSLVTPTSPGRGMPM